MRKKKQSKKIPGKLPDFTLEDIINAPKPKEDIKIDGIGCLHCGSTRIISKGEIKVFRGQRMKAYHCHNCGKDYYKGER